MTTPRKWGVARASIEGSANCVACGLEVIFAHNDAGQLVPVDPDEAARMLIPEMRAGSLVLWFDVDPKGRPIGKQRASTATEEQRRDSTIPLWCSHLKTCTPRTRRSK